MTPFDTQSFIGDGTSGLVGAETAGITTAEVAGAGMMTSVVTDTEVLNGYFRCPVDLDPDWPVGFRVCWTLLHDDTGTGNMVATIDQNTVAKGAAIVLPTTVLDTDIGTTTYTDTGGAISVVDWLLQYSNRGIRNSIGLTRDQIEAGAFITFQLTFTTFDNETTAHYVGMEMDYAPQMTQGLGNHTDPSLTATGPT